MSVEWDENGKREFMGRCTMNVRIDRRSDDMLNLCIDDPNENNWAITPAEARAIADRLYKLADEIDAEKES